LIIELDGKIHEQTAEYDNDRTMILIEKGYYLLRFKNEELSNIQNVLKTIIRVINQLSH